MLFYSQPLSKPTAYKTRAILWKCCSFARAIFVFGFIFIANYQRYVVAVCGLFSSQIHNGIISSHWKSVENNEKKKRIHFHALQIANNVIMVQDVYRCRSIVYTRVLIYSICDKLFKFVTDTLIWIRISWTEDNRSCY